MLAGHSAVWHQDGQREQHAMTVSLTRLGSLMVLLNLLAATWCMAAPASPPVQILTSINPLTLIINEAFGDLVVSESLLPPRASPHFYTLKPSDIQRLAATELFVWVGPELERFLPKVLGKSSPGAVVELIPRLLGNHPARLLTFDGVALPNPGGNGVVASPSESSAERSVQSSRERTEIASPPLPNAPRESHSSPVAGSLAVRPSGRNLDAHIWMSKILAAEIAAEIAAELAVLRPMHGDTIRQRLNDFRATLVALDIPVKLPGVVLVSYHNAFNYLAKELGLHICDVIISQTDLTPGARHFAQLAERFAQHPHCLIVEPQFRDTRLTATLGRLASAVVELDPMGANAPSYSALYRSWGAQLERCGG